MLYRTFKLISIAFSFYFFGCATTNYYTAQTLEQGQMALTPGIDNLILVVDDDENIEKDAAFTPSLGIATGLPYRFETGIRAYIPYILEANLRHQLNPRTFKYFDLSINGHMGVVFSDEFSSVSDPYFKYGLTLSKEIGAFQPFVSYYFNKSYVFRDESDGAVDYKIICFGLAFRHKGNLIIPEFNYYKQDYVSKGILSFGIGIRAILRKPNKKEVK
ncbi:MAG: hypothetical protein JXR46_11910 [Calditrichaceae bacterium]|nr:hypothetical protein [Calditrichaceae bacterium]MBN2709740.1 hypothetical protein [Calditrichaceae bacterium]RQV94078.1 MAG: hypothetical protein EH224_11090 [Calditrichota bacterium]